MIKLLHLNKLLIITIFFTALIFESDAVLAAVDIWEKKENKNKQNNQINDEKEITIKSPILSDDIKKITIEIDEQKPGESNRTLIGLLDPEENNFNLNMWVASDGKDIKDTFKRINKLKLSQFSEDLLFTVLFTNAYSPKINLTSSEFIKIKIDWLINKKRVEDLEILLKKNPVVGKNSKAIKFLINEYLSLADIKSACEKINFIDSRVQNKYLEKFTIYCLINNDQKEEAQLVFDLLLEGGLKDKFYEDKINYLFFFY